MSDLSELKKVLEDQGRTFDEFKKANDALIAAKAEGKAVGELTAKVEAINEQLSKIDEQKAAIEDTLVKLQRSSSLAGAGEKGVDPEIELKSFNLMLRANAKSGAPAAVVEAEHYTAYKSAFMKLLRGGPNMLNGDEQKALIAGSDPDGGYMLPAAAVGRMVSKVFELSPIRQIASVQSISGPALEGMYDNDESSSGWVGEVAARTDTTTPQVGKYRIEAFEMYAQPKASQTVLDDAATDVEGWLAGKVANRFARKEADAFINGDGLVQPRGFATYATAATADSTRTWGTIEHKATGVSADFAASSPGDILFDLIQAFKPNYLQRASWVTRREVIAKIRKFKEATTNAYMWQPGLQAGQPDKLLGYPIVIAQDIPTLAASSLSMWLGDWSEAYQIVDRMGVRTLRDPFTSKPYVVFYSTMRVGGQVLNFEAIKAIKFI
jgi:HK97 family phage major capsid protein